MGGIEKAHRLFPLVRTLFDFACIHFAIFLFLLSESLEHAIVLFFFYIPVVNIRTVMRVVADGVVTLQSHCCLEPEVKVARSLQV